MNHYVVLLFRDNADNILFIIRKRKKVFKRLKILPFTLLLKENDLLHFTDYKFKGVLEYICRHQMLTRAYTCS